MSDKRSFPSYRMYQDKAGEWRWTYNAGNGQAISMASEGYTTRKACERSIEIMQESAGHAVWHDTGA